MQYIYVDVHYLRKLEQSRETGNLPNIVPYLRNAFSQVNFDHSCSAVRFPEKVCHVFLRRRSCVSYVIFTVINIHVA